MKAIACISQTLLSSANSLILVVLARLLPEYFHNMTYWQDILARYQKGLLVAPPISETTRANQEN